VLVSTAWAQTQEGQEGQDQSQAQGVVAVPIPEARSIDIRDNRFEPADATVAPGTTLMWINYDQAQHTVTADDGQFDSGVLDPGDIFVVTVEGAGKLTYHCTLHPEMKGSVTLGEGDGGEATTTEKANPALDEPTGEAPPAKGASTEGAPPAEETSTQEEAAA
jgi:plastocyanin